jgi:hypothetical protein
MNTKHVAPSSNKLLARLPAADYDLSWHFETVPLPFKQVLHRGGEELRRVYFPAGGVCSITHVIALTQSAACNTLHSVEERLARWLVMSHDRMGQDDFQLTQEFLAIMLSVHHSSVTLAFGALSRADLIDHATRRFISRIGRGSRPPRVNAMQRWRSISPACCREPTASSDDELADSTRVAVCGERTGGSGYTVQDRATQRVGIAATIGIRSVAEDDGIAARSRIDPEHGASEPGLPV